MSQLPANRLAESRSPYLRQHAGNPVHWQPWSEEAFELARTTGRPIFLSIGYSTCHWCHVMAHESFEDETAATLLNTLFVPIKVDREERPDVDRLYMAFVQATTGLGGWPLSVWLTPDLKPFYGGTYFPLESRHGRAGFLEILRRIGTAWAQQRAQLEARADALLEHLRETTLPPSSHHEPDPSQEDLVNAVGAFAAQFDREHGGFGAGPKFPRPAALLFLARAAARFPENSETRARATEMLAVTLRRMAAGGIRDHLGGGFHRYAVDAAWHVPHFEKMLYDQAQLACAYADGFLLTREPGFAEVLRTILDYVERDLAAPEGGFCGAEDADSLRHAADREPVEGAFYVWTAEEISRSLDPEFAPVFEYAYGILPEGNCPPEHDPSGELVGRNVLFERRSIEETAARFSLGASEAARLLADARRRLLAARSTRPRPARDDKVIAAWNGLMISGFSRAAQALGDPGYARSASRTAAALRQRLWNTTTRTLCRLPRVAGEADRPGFAEDYAYVIQGLLDLYETTFEHAWLAWATELQDRMDELYFDETLGGYFSSPPGDPSLLLRQKDDYDGAEPTASSVAALNLIRLHEILHQPEYLQRAIQTVRAFAPVWRRDPTALPALLATADFLVGPARQVLFLGEREDPRLTALVRTAHGVFGSRRTLVLCDGGPGQRWLATRQPIYADLKSSDGLPAAQVCENFTCQPPVTQTVKLRALLTQTP